MGWDYVYSCIDKLIEEMSISKIVDTIIDITARGNNITLFYEYADIEGLFCWKIILNRS